MDMAQNILGLIVPGQQVITDFVPTDSSGLKFLLTIPFSVNNSPTLISDLVIFLLPGISLPNGSGALIYWSACPIYANPNPNATGTGFELLGALTPTKPSGVFRTGWSTNESLIQLLQQQQTSGGGVSITLGVSIEPIANITNIPGVENNGVENRGDIAKKIALDLFRYLQSFDDAGSKKGWMSVPTNVFERWYRRFEEKLAQIFISDTDKGVQEENYNGMIYMGKLDSQGYRLRFDVDNRLKFIFGSSYAPSVKSHLQQQEFHDVADRAHNPTVGRMSPDDTEFNDGPKPYGHVDTNELDGGVTPPKLVRVEPFFLDEVPVTNNDFRAFVSATYYKTDAERFGWSFVLVSFLPKVKNLNEMSTDPEATNWVAVDGAYWRQPEGPGSSYKHRENHPVVHVSHKDAAEYCKWVGKRLPGEREWEAAARFKYYGSKNRTVFLWGNEPTWNKAILHANLWGNGTFPWNNTAEDGWIGTSPVRHYLANAAGFYDMTGNVWEWMRGGKQKQRILRGGSYVDSLDGTYNHAATLGARTTVHGTTTSGNIGFRCARSPHNQAGRITESEDETGDDDYDESKNLPKTRRSDEL